MSGRQQATIRVTVPRAVFQSVYITDEIEAAIKRRFPEVSVHISTDEPSSFQPKRQENK